MTKCVMGKIKKCIQKNIYFDKVVDEEDLNAKFSGLRFLSIAIKFIPQEEGDDTKQHNI